MTESNPAQQRLQAAIRDYIREYGDGGIAGDWLLVAHFIPADGVGDSYVVTGRDGLPDHAARGLLDYARDELYEVYVPVDEDDEWCPGCGSDDHIDIDDLD